VAQLPNHPMAQMLTESSVEAAKHWLRERRDIAECHETRIELLEWMILLFLGFEVLVDAKKLIYG
jgi:hypothetical protein